MSHDGDDNRASGWNRRFIEEHFGKETADRMRRALMNIWREDCPTLPSERPEGQQGTYLVRWKLGLAALYAEAEDPSWATKLTDEEAELAARYAPIELNGLPLWMESLVAASPEAVDAILGSELTWELNRGPRGRGHSMLLQNISYASEPVAKLFLPRLHEWLDGNDDVIDDANELAAGTRDHAEEARGAIVSALLEVEGEEGWAAKLEMASDPLCAHFKDRIIAVAEENWAQEIDSDAFSETQAVALDKTGEAPASTNEAMFGIICDRLSDLDDLLLSDASPRDAWAGITDEKVMRREIARELSNKANGLYKVDQEAATADEKKTDIRLRSVVSEHEAIIELKRAESWSARQMRDTIHDQLITKYMAPENSRSGCLLVTLAKEDRKWEHPDSGARIGPSELMALLRDEAKREEEAMGGAAALSVRLLDLRPRLGPEKT